jgi:hypothetical protein
MGKREKNIKRNHLNINKDYQWNVTYVKRWKAQPKTEF